MNKFPVPIVGGLDGTSPDTEMHPGRLRIGINCEVKPSGKGIRRVEGYKKFDTTAVPGEGDILGVHIYGGKVYAARNAVGGLTAAIHSSTGSGWTTVKSGLAPGGDYHFENYDFAGVTKMFGVSGVHQAFQWDGSTWTDIASALPAPDWPTHLAVHKKHLFLARNRRVVNSSLGVPTTFSALTGAADMLVRRDVTGFSTLPNGALGIFTSEGIHILSGTTAADFIATNLTEYGNLVGALPGTIMQMGSSVRFADSRGVTDLNASQVSSDFYDSIISHDVDEQYEGKWIYATCATVIRNKKQYRIFFGDGTGLIFVFTPNGVGVTEIQYPKPVLKAVNGEDSLGNEVVYFGSDDGYIYEMEDNARNFDGTAIASYAELAFTNFQRPSQIKFLRRIRFSAGKNGKADLTAVPQSFVGTAGIDDAAVVTPSFYNETDLLGSGLLGSMKLGGVSIDLGRAPVRRRGEWFNVRFVGSSADSLPWEIDGVIYEFLDGKPIT